MPYIHKKCGGEISFWSRKCKKCHKSWPVSALFATKPPKDMVYEIPRGKDRGPTTYAKWADKIPMVAEVTRRLPNWPRWARILSVLIVTLVISTLVILFIRNLGG